MKFQQTRETVLATCLALAERGYLAGTGGNIALSADEDHFAVTRSTIDYYAMTTADICVLRNHGVVCVGIGAAEAMNRVATLESACVAFFHAHATDNSLPVDGSVRSLVADTLRLAL